MRVLIIGGDGMLGHVLYRALRRRHNVRFTVRSAVDATVATVLNATDAYHGVDVRNTDAVARAVRDFAPQAVFNASGVVKQRDDMGNDKELCMEVNARFPHTLARLCASAGAFLVQYSTDCVFSGDRGGYREDDPTDAHDLYGRSKLLGEVHEPGCITLRTSMIGFELRRKSGLLEWFLSQERTVKGWRRAIFSGLTTLEHARIAERILDRVPRTSGLFHVAGDAVSKYGLLTMIKHHFCLSTRIVPDDSVVIDRSLDATRFGTSFGYSPPRWDGMIAELARSRGRE